MTRDDLTEGQNESLRWLREALVCGFLNDAEGFKVNPHWVGWVSEPSMGEGICCQQVAEFVVDDRLRNWQNRQQSRPQSKGKQSDDDYGKRPSAGQVFELALDFFKP